MKIIFSSYLKYEEEQVSSTLTPPSTNFAQYFSFKELLLIKKMFPLWTILLKKWCISSMLTFQSWKLYCGYVRQYLDFKNDTLKF